MRVLLDHCLDWRLSRYLPGHTIKAAGKLGWGGLKDRPLLARAATPRHAEGVPLPFFRPENVIVRLVLEPRRLERRTQIQPGLPPPPPTLFASITPSMRAEQVSRL